MPYLEDKLKRLRDARFQVHTLCLLEWALNFYWKKVSLASSVPRTLLAVLSTVIYGVLVLN